MKTKLITAALALSALTVGSGAQEASTLDRTVLPIAEPTYPPITELDARNATPPRRSRSRRRRARPMCIVILLDNFGYAGSKTFGGVMNMPTLERLATNGLIYNNFHTAPDLLADPRGAAHGPQSP